MYRVFLLVSLLAELAPGISGYVTTSPLYDFPSTTQTFGSMQGTPEMGQTPGATQPNFETTPASQGPSEGDPLGLGIVGYEAVPFEGPYGEAGYRIAVPGMPSFAIAIPTSTGYQVIETAEVQTTTAPVPVERITTSSHPGFNLFGLPNGPDAALTTGGVTGVLAESGVVHFNGAVGRPDPPFGAVQTSYPSSRPDPPTSSGVAPNPPISMVPGNTGSRSGSYTVSKPHLTSNVRAPPSPTSSMLSGNVQPNSAMGAGQSLWDQINTSVMGMNSVLPLALISDNIDPIYIEPLSFNNMENLQSGVMPMGLMGQMGLSMPSFNTGMMTGQGLSSSVMQKKMASMQLPMQAASQSFPQLPQGPSPYQNLFSGLIGTEAPATVGSFAQPGKANPQMPSLNQAKTLMSAMMKSAIAKANLSKSASTLLTSHSQSFGLSPHTSSSNMGSAYAKIMAQMAPKGGYSVGAPNLMGDYSSRYASPSSQMETLSENGYSAYTIPERMGSHPQPSTRNNAMSSSSQALNFMYSQSRKMESSQKPSIPRNVLPKRPNFSVIAKPTNGINFPSARNTAKTALAAAQSLLMAERAKAAAQSSLMAERAKAAAQSSLMAERAKAAAQSSLMAERAKAAAQSSLMAERAKAAAQSSLMAERAKAAAQSSLMAERAKAAAQSSLMAGRAESINQSMARNAAAASRSMLQNAQKKLSAPGRPYPQALKSPAAGKVRTPSPSLSNAKRIAYALKLKLAMQTALKKLPYSMQAKMMAQTFPKKNLPTQRPHSRGMSPMEMMILSGSMMELAL